MGEVGQLYVLDGTRVESAYDAGSSQYRFEMQGEGCSFLSRDARSFP